MTPYVSSPHRVPPMSPYLSVLYVSSPLLDAVIGSAPHNVPVCVPTNGVSAHCPPQRPYMRPHLYWTQQWGQCPTGPPPVSPPMGSVPYRTLTTSPYVSSPHKIPPMSPRLNVPICVSTSIGRSDAVSAPLTPPSVPICVPTHGVSAPQDAHNVPICVPTPTSPPMGSAPH